MLACHSRQGRQALLMDKRKFLFASLSGLIGDIAWQVSKEGHDVRYYIEAEKERDIADGLVPKSKDWEKDANWADIVVFDDTLGQGTRAQTLRAAGKPVIGGTAYTDNLEYDRNFGQEELKKAGVTIIPYQQFDSFDPAIEFVKKNPDRYVIKPSGEAQNVKRRRRYWHAGSLQARLLRGDQGFPVAAPRQWRGSGRRRLLQRQKIYHAHQRQLRAQEAIPRRSWPAHR